MQCQAKNRKGEQCKKTAVEGKRVCRLHGGLTPSGPASPNFKHGRYSKYLPPNLMGKYDEARRDPDLLNSRDEISLLDARLMQLVEKLPEGGASHSWKEVQETWKEFIDAQRMSNNARTDEQKAVAQRKTADALRKLNEIIEEGAQEAALWNDIIISIDNRRKLAASEAKRLSEMQQYITSEKVIALVYALVDIIRRTITDYVADQDLQKKLTSIIAEKTRALVTIPARNEHDN